MEVVVLDKQVRRNLALFKHLLHRQAEKTKGYFRIAKKVYKGFVNCKTGEMTFELLEKGRPLSKEWKPVSIQLRPKEDGAFEVLSSESEGSFDCSQLEEKAYNLFTKTIHILNQLSYDPTHRRNPFWILRHVAHIDFLLSKEEEGQPSLIHQAWHNVDREGAEYLLSGMSPGTYMFRKDSYAKYLEDKLNETQAEPVICMTLTYRDWDQKIGEKTAIYQSGRWFFYDDDPDLEGSRYDSMEVLLKTMGEQVRRPLLAD